MTIPNCLEWAHELVTRAITEGKGFAVDATAGNGHDTLHLARLAKPEGHVWAFDIQEQALENTRAKLEAANLLDRVTLLHQSHADLLDHLPESYVGQIDATMFNLGYLPGGDPSVITRTQTTLRALDAALASIRPGGVVTVVLYSGHEGSEEQEVLGWAEGLDSRKVRTLRYDFPFQRNHPPAALCLERLT